MLHDDSTRLIVFLKAPRPGHVKTRLGQSLGADAACAAYRTLAGALFDQLAGLNWVELCFTPDDALPAVAPWLRGDWRAAAQGRGELGTRLVRAFERHFVAGAKRVLIIGSDCPWVTKGDIRNAAAALVDADVVLGPATDGGYWLVGLNKPRPQLFAGIDWSTERVLAQTLARAEGLGLQTALLRELSDVDTEEDWRRFLSQRAAAAP
jgi:uncharacterized protein